MPATEVYPFTQYSSGILYPLIPVSIIHPSNPRLHFGEMALLDTGADHCVFPARIPKAMGYDLKSGKYASSQGVGKIKVGTWEHSFRILLFSNDKKKIIWDSKECKVGCLEHDNTPVLLGYSNFLSHFNITFSYPTKKIIIEIP